MGQANRVQQIVFRNDWHYDRANSILIAAGMKITAKLHAINLTLEMIVGLLSTRTTFVVGRCLKLQNSTYEKSL